MPSDPHAFVKTTVWKTLTRRMAEAHELVMVAPFAGPPGIGKSQALRSFVAARPAEVVRVEPVKDGTQPGEIVREILDAISRVCPSVSSHPGTTGTRLWRILDNAILEWSQYQSFENLDKPAPTTVAIDEAQRITPKGVEALRYFYDAPNIGHQVGFILMGNNEFHLQGRDSFLSGPMTSRAAPPIILDHLSNTDHDIALIINARGEFTAEAVELILAHCRSRKVNRDLHALDQKLKVMLARAAGGAVNEKTVKSFISTI